ncbi:Beta-lactamase-related protein, partial [human gut metagenome]
MKVTEKVEKDDLYDLASLTKTTATLLAVMKLYDEGKFGLTDRISQYIPALKGTDKERVTIEELLLHQSGIPAFWPFYKEAIDKDSYKGSFYRA